MAEFPQLDPPLGTRTVRLRIAAERDIPEVLIAYQDDPRLHLALGEDRPPSGAELGRRAERMDADRTAGARLVLAVVESGEDVCRGEVRVSDVDWENLRARVSVWVVPQARGRGVGSQALGLASTWLLEAVGLNRAGMECEAVNAAGVRAAQAAGYQSEGVLRQHWRRGHGRVDVAVLSRVRDLGGG